MDNITGNIAQWIQRGFVFQGQFCMWKGLDFCGEGCLGKFQAGISTSCTLCTAFIPLTARSTNCLRLGTEVSYEARDENENQLLHRNLLSLFRENSSHL